MEERGGRKGRGGREMSRKGERMGEGRGGEKGGRGGRHSQCRQTLEGGDERGCCRC